jgi:type VI secretion system secreted protein Hcp
MAELSTTTRFGTLGSATVPGAPRVDYFLTVDGISGESADARHEGAIEILDWTFGFTQSARPGGGAGGGAGRVTAEPLVVVARTSSASPAIVSSVVSGRHHATASLSARRSGERQEDFLVITLEDVLISSYHAAPHPDDGAPLDVVGLSFARLRYEIGKQRPDGTIGAPVTAEADLGRGRGR